MPPQQVPFEHKGYLKWEATEEGRIVLPGQLVIQAERSQVCERCWGATCSLPPILGPVAFTEDFSPGCGQGKGVD